jgi:hypothetical protein
MTSLRKSSLPQAGRTIVLSIKPKDADLILAGTKTVEFRRAWAAEKVDAIAIYASAPIQRIVGVAQVSNVVSAKPTLLWDYCKKRGGFRDPSFSPTCVARQGASPYSFVM